MDEKIQNYITERKEEISLEREKEKHQLLEKLELGKRKYSDSSKCTLDFPLYDDVRGKSYGIDTAQNLTETEYEEIRKYAPKGYGLAAELSQWHTFAKVMIILGAVGVGIVLLICLSNDEYLPLIIAIGAYLTELVFWGMLQLLAKIEANTRKDQ